MHLGPESPVLVTTRKKALYAGPPRIHAGCRQRLHTSWLASSADNGALVVLKP